MPAASARRAAASTGADVAAAAQHGVERAAQRAGGPQRAAATAGVSDQTRAPGEHDEVLGRAQHVVLRRLRPPGRRSC